MRGYVKSNQKLGVRVLSALLAAAVPFTSLHAASTDLADVPMAIKTVAAPNIMLTLDDSGSMMFEMLPDDVMPDSATNTNPNCSSFNAGRRATPYMFPIRSGAFGGGDYGRCVVGFESTNRYARYLRTSDYNKIYYNPRVRYTPWANSTGSNMADATPSAAYFNPMNTGVGARNLTTDLTITTNWLADDGSSSNVAQTFYPATYYVYTGGAPLTSANDVNNIPANFTRVEIRSGTASYTKLSSDRTDCASTTVCTYAEEIQNFANWFQYYRNRILAARAGIGRAFSSLSTEPRVGFAAINKGTSTIDGVDTKSVVNGVRQFTGSDRSNFFSTFYGYTINTNGTPLRISLEEVGSYFSRTDDSGPWGKFPGSNNTTPHAACRQTFNILMTDGYWGDTYSNAGNADNTASGTLNGFDNLGAPISYTYTPGNPYSDSYSNTLADVAMKYWITDLRTDLANKVPKDSVDPAFWQHMVNFTVGLGVFGTIPKSTIDQALTTSPPTITWPDPTAALPNKIDDLAHAAVNSRGGFYSASNPDEFANSLSSALNDLISRTGSGAAIAVANPNVTPADNTSYASKYNSGGWYGDLSAYPIDVNTGIVSTTAIWSAMSQLDALSAASRNIVTHTGDSGTGQGRIFKSPDASGTRISATQLSYLNSTTTPPGPSDGDAVLDYLRGVRTNEGTTYRTRVHVLGDIINAEAVIVRPPSSAYTDNGYASFVTAQSTRPTVIFQSANDGMVHAFNGSNGVESWAYIPSFLFNGPSKLRNLAKKTGFTHQYYVDATPFLADVDLSNTSGSGATSPNWKSVLVGGLGKGGRGWYALDVTTPLATSESDAASKVMWEFPNTGTTGTVDVTTPDGFVSGGLAMNINKVGYSFGKPIVAKSKAHGWVALIPSGYNNGADTGGDGHGYLFVVNIRNGAVLHVFDTGGGVNPPGNTGGSASSPSGLAQVVAWADSGNTDSTVTYVYGGDLNGDVWRFDLNSVNTSEWKVKRLVNLVDASGNAQPVTTKPDLAGFFANGAARRVVYLGTGKYLGDSDVATSDVQSMYGLVDNLSNPSGYNTVIPSPTRSNLQQQVLSGTAVRTNASLATVDYTTKRGWFVDLNVSGERLTSDPTIVARTLVFTSNIPSSDVCTPGGSSYYNVLDYRTGGVVQNGTTWMSFYLGAFLSSAPRVIRLPNGGFKSIIRTSAGETLTNEGPPSSVNATPRRVSWREILEDGQ